MIEPSPVAATQIRYELRYTSLFDAGRGFAFLCDAEGHVDLNELTHNERTNYFFARGVVGTELSPPVVSRVA